MFGAPFLLLMAPSQGLLLRLHSWKVQHILWSILSPRLQRPATSLVYSHAFIHSLAPSPNLLRAGHWDRTWRKDLRSECSAITWVRVPEGKGQTRCLWCSVTEESDWDRKGHCPGWGSQGWLPRGVKGEINLSHMTAQRRQVYTRLRDVACWGKCPVICLTWHIQEEKWREQRMPWWWPVG